MPYNVSFLAYFFEQFGKSAFRMSAHPVSGEVTLASDSTQPSGGFTFSDGIPNPSCATSARSATLARSDPSASSAT